MSPPPGASRGRAPTPAAAVRRPLPESQAGRCQAAEEAPVSSPRSGSRRPPPVPAPRPRPARGAVVTWREPPLGRGGRAGPGRAAPHSIAAAAGAAGPAPAESGERQEGGGDARAAGARGGERRHRTGLGGSPRRRPAPPLGYGTPRASPAPRPPRIGPVPRSPHISPHPSAAPTPAP